MPALTSDHLKAVYDQLCNSYHKVDDFRAKLLGFLPLASGIAFYGLLDPGENNKISEHLTEIGLFGALITLGLLIYELKGIQKCTGFIHYGNILEKKLLEDEAPLLKGIFAELGADRISNWFASEPVASALVYSTVLASWLYITPLGWHAVFFGLLCLIWVFIFWKLLAGPIQPNLENPQTKNSDKNK
jgi:hypothetical protein